MGSQEVKKARAHLRREPKLAALIRALPEPQWEPARPPFEALCSAIIYQQLSGKAAATIYTRWSALYRGTPTPRKVANTTLSTFRSVGVSQQKAGYLLDLAHKFLDGTVAPKHFHEMTDEAIRAHLIAVKGVGRWTADMFLMFTLHRPDVLPTGDLGIQKAMQKLYKLKKIPDHDQMEKLAAPWRPYRTMACRYLWSSLDTP